MNKTNINRDMRDRERDTPRRVDCSGEKENVRGKKVGQQLEVSKGRAELIIQSRARQ